MSTPVTFQRRRTRREPFTAAPAIAMLAIVSGACEPLQQPDAAPPRATRPAPPDRAVAKEPQAPPTAAQPAPVASSGPMRRVALLLPLSGNQAGVAEALRDGFLAAHFASPEPRPEVLILDEEQPDAAAAYRTAMDSGADAVVGPLLKESAARVAQLAGVVPTLALNYLDTTAAPPPFFQQFALSPEDEAAQAAEQAIAEQRFRAVALAPDSDWGRRLLGAFQARLAELGGTVLASRLYDMAATDYTADIQRLLLIDESRNRHRQLAAFLGQSLDFEPRRRGDLDFIFLAANPAAGRLIRPQLRFLYAGDVPTYSTSAIFQAGTGSEDDLEGIVFADAPAVIDPQGEAQDLRAALARRWPPGAQQRMRLYAMGYDAWQLMMAMKQGRAVMHDGLSGRLHTDPQGRVHRQLSWAEIRDGRVVPRAATLPLIAPTAGAVSP